MGTLPALVPFQVPQMNLGDTFTQMAKLAAYDQARRTSALEQEEKRSKLDREALWRQTIAGAIQPPAPVPGQGFAAAPMPQAQATPQMPALLPGSAQPGGTSLLGATGQPGGFTATMAQQVPPATPEQGSYARLAPGGGIPPVGTSYGNAPLELHSRAALEGIAGGGQPGMPPEITAMAQPVDRTQPTLQGGGFTAAPAGTPTPTPTGFTAPQPTRPLSASVPNLMPLPNAEAVQRAFAIDPEKTSQWYGAYLTQRGKQLEEVKRNNQLVYQTTSAMLEHPEYYQEGLDYLREQGVPVPKNMPTTYNPALVAFHRDVSRERLNPLEEAQTENQRALAKLNQAKVGTEEAFQRELLRPGGAGPPEAGGTSATASSRDPVPTLDTSTLTPGFLSKSQQVADRLGMRQDDLLRIMHYETGGTFDAGVRNRAGSGATGLIQFMPGTAKELGTTTEALAKMSPEQQLDYVEKYLSKFKGKIDNLQDAYMAVLYPAAIGKSGNHKLFTKEGNPTAYRQNAGLDTDGKGYVTVSDAVSAVKRTTGGMDASPGGDRATTTTTTASPEAQRLTQKIAEAEQKMERYRNLALMGHEGAKAYMDDTRADIKRWSDERTRLEEPQRAAARETAVQQAQRAQREREQAGPLLPEQSRELFLKARTDIRAEPTHKVYQGVRNGYQNVRIGAELDNAQGDLAIINGLAKILDPEGVVMTGEARNVEEAQGQLQRWYNTPQKFFEGDRLSSENRPRFLELARRLAREKLTTAEKELRQVYGPIAKQGGFEFTQLLPLEEIPDTPRGGTPGGGTGPVADREGLLDKHTIRPR